MALERGELFVAYQPIFDVERSLIVSSEALVRWRHPVRGTVSAGEFIPIAEETGLIDAIGAFVLEEACRAARGWGGAVPVVVNLSPRQLRSNSFLQTLETCLQRSGLSAERLGLEVTETVFLDLTERTTRQIQAIRKLGVRLILDDFGTGYSSLTYIRTFDFDGLKIDAAFTRDLPGSRKVAAIVRTISRLASDLGMSLTAEGVESREQLLWLRTNGVTLAQGYPARHAPARVPDRGADQDRRRRGEPPAARALKDRSRLRRGCAPDGSAADTHQTAQPPIRTRRRRSRTRTFRRVDRLSRPNLGPGARRRGGSAGSAAG